MNWITVVTDITSTIAAIICFV